MDDSSYFIALIFFFFQAEDGIRDVAVTGVQTCALPISLREVARLRDRVLGEAGAALQVGLVGEALEELVHGEHELERQAGEEIADLARLAFVAGGDQELHARRSRASRSVVEYPGTSGTRTTRPPQRSTWSAPTIASRAYSAPLTSTSGRRRSISPSGVSASNTTTRSTQASAATSRARSASGTSGRVAPPFPSRRTDASLFTATSSASPSARAASSSATWPTCSRSKTPLVNTTGPR